MIGFTGCTARVVSLRAMVELSSHLCPAEAAQASIPAIGRGTCPRIRGPAPPTGLDMRRGPVSGSYFTFVLDFIMEACMLLPLGLCTYPGAIRSVSFNAGHYYQWPIYEGLMWGAVQAGLACLRFFTDDRGRTIVERGLDQVRGGVVRQQLARAAVSSRRLGARAGVNSALVYYYFGNMDNLFVALFRRGAERSYQRLAAAAAADQPLWALWDAIHDQSRTALTMEFVSLATHRPSIRSEIAQSSKRFRELQLDIVSRALQGRRPDPWTPMTLVMLMSSVSRFLRMEEAFDIDAGHAEITAVIEDALEKLEGTRRPEGS